MTAPGPAAPADGDFTAVLPAALDAATAGRSIVIGWLSRGGGAPLELITTVGPPDPGSTGDAGPAARTALPSGTFQATVAAGGEQGAPPRISMAPEPAPLLFPPGAWGLPVAGGCAEDLGRLVWAPCPAVRDLGRQWPELVAGPSLFETALIALMRRPFGWLVVAEPTDLLAAETAGLRTELDIPRRHREWQADTVDRTERCPAERGDSGDGGLWSVRVLAGASGPDELDVLAPLLAGSAELEPHPYRLHSGTGAQSLDEALSATRHDPGDGAQSPFLVMAGTIAALAGLPRLGVPGLNVTGAADPGTLPAAGAVAAGAVAAGGAVPAGAAGSIGGAEPAGAADSAGGAHPATRHAHGAAPEGLNAPEPPSSAAPDGDDGGTGVSADRLAAESIELGVALEPSLGPSRVPVAAFGQDVLVTDSAGAGPPRTVRQILTQLTRLGLPWLAVDPAGSGYETVTADRGGPPITVINPCDPDAVPLTISPLALEPGYPLQAHIALVRRLLDVAFGADELFSLAVSLALPRVYEAAGWDLHTGRSAYRPAYWAVGRAPAVPAVPGLGQLHAAVTGVIREAGYDRRTRARLCALADARFGSLRTGSAGRFLDGGHPADLGVLLRRPAVLALHDIGAAEDRAFVTGALLIRLAEYLRLRARQQESPSSLGSPPRHVLVLGEARAILRDRGEDRPATHAAEWLAALLAEFGAHGEGAVLAGPRPARLVPDVSRDAAVRIVHPRPAAESENARKDADKNADKDAIERADQVPLLTPEVAVLLAGDAGPPRGGRIADLTTTAPGTVAPGDVTPLLSGRRSVACGRACREGRACHLAELREAELLAISPEHAWLRVWTEAFLLAFLTDNLLPAVPPPLCRRWRGNGARARECLLARLLDQRVGVRAAALRMSYDPSRFGQVVASAAAIRLDRAGAGGGPAAGPAGGVPSATRPGPAWVIPQLRWLHEIERLCPLRGPGLAPADHAPPLDFDLNALPDWPGIRVGQRVRALRRHPLSMELAANRRLAWIALAGEDGPGPLAADLAQVMPGMDHAQALRHAAALMQVSGRVSAGPGWLETVLSWPRRFVAFSSGQRPPDDAADWPSG